MRLSEAAARLSARDREVLDDVICTFIVTGEPVSSRTVAKQGRLGLSAATIRNVMADLEDLGFLNQPHTSAGRVPTSAGYHLYIEELMTSEVVPLKRRLYIEDHLRSGSSAGADRVATATQLASELSQQVAVLLTPDLGKTVLKTVDFLPLSGNRILCVVVSESGFMDSKVVESDEPIGKDELVRISNYLTEQFGGSTLRQARDRLLALMDDERAQVDRLLGLSVSLARTGLEKMRDPELLVQGTASVLMLPELENLVRVRRLFDTFEEKARFVQILNQCLQGRGVRVVIGEDSEVTSELDFSLVATTYGVKNRPLGALGVFGPSRMEYSKVIPLVEYLGQRLSLALSETME